MRKIKLFLSLLMVMLLSVGNVWAADPEPETLFSFTGTSQYTIPNGWSSNEVSTGNYLGFSANGSYLISPLYDPHNSVSLSFTVACLNSGTNHALTIYVLDKDDEVKKTYTTGTPTGSSNYINTNSPWEIGDINYKFKIKFYLPEAGKGVRLRNTSLTGVTVSACTSEVEVTKGAETNGTYTLSDTKVCGDGDGGEITISNIEPADGYAFDEITATAGTVDNENKKVTGITAATTITVLFKELQKYTVTFSTGEGNPTVDSKTEASAGAGITLPAGPTPACSADGWTFAGWAASAVASETTTAPTLLAAGANYKPAENVTLYAVYKKEAGSDVGISDYTITFDDNSSDASSDISDSDFITYITTNASKVSSVSDITKCYKGATGLKLSSKKNNGSFVMTLSESNAITKVVLNTKKKSTTQGAAYEVLVGSTTFSTSSELSKDNFVDVEFTGTKTNSNSLSIKSFSSTNEGSDSDGRVAWLKSITIYYEAEITTYNYLSAPSCCEKHAITIANNIENGSVSADLSEACEGTTVTLTFTPATNYHLSAWTLNGAAQDVNANTFSMPAGVATISATFEQDACDPLAEPVVTVSGKDYPYDAVQLAWTAIEQADAYKVYIYDAEDNELEHIDAFTGVEYTIGQTLSASTTYKYSVQAISNTPATYCPSVAATGSFVTEALPTAHLTLIALGEDQQASGDYSILTPFELPSTAAACSKTFMGWDANPECAIAPTYSKGAEFTFQNTTGVTLYAVYADETPGEAIIKTDVLDYEFTGLSGTSYKTWSGKTGTSGAVYAGQSCALGNSASSTYIQLRTNNSNSGVVTTTTGAGKVTKVTVTWNSSQGADGSKLDVYGKNTAYSQATDLYGDNAGTLLGSIVKGTSTELVITGSYSYLGLRSNNGTVYLDEIDVQWTAQGASTYSNYSTTCVAAPTAEPASASIAVAAAGDEGTLGVSYENVNLAGVEVALFNNEACTEAFDGGWLTATIEGDDKHIAYNAQANTSYNDARTAYIKLTAPETNGAANPAVVVIPVEQAKKPAVFASLEDLVAAELASGTEVTVSFSNVMITEVYETNAGYRYGLYLNVKDKDGENDIELFYNKQGDSEQVPDTWVKNGYVSATNLVTTWTEYKGQWELAMQGATWSWENGDITYGAPKAVTSVVVSGEPTKKAYVDGEKFNPAGLTVTVNYTIGEPEVIAVTDADWEFTPERLAKGETGISVKATYNTVQSAAFNVTGLTVGDIQLKTIEEFIAAGNADMRCYLEGIASDIETGSKLKYGNFNLTDASGTIYVYGCLNQAGEAEQFDELDIHNGDKIKVIAEDYDFYNSKHEAKNVQFVSKTSPVDITITSGSTVEKGKTLTLTATTDPAAAIDHISYSVKVDGNEGNVSLSDNVLTGVEVGEATIIASIPDGEGYIANSVEFTVEVTAAIVHGSITYVENGANEDIDDVADATALPDPLPTVTKDNFLFGGWYTDAEFNTPAVAGAALSEDVTLYAKWNAIPYYATVYTSNVDFVGGGNSHENNSKVVINTVEYKAQKVGASSNTGTVTVTVPAYTHTLHFHVFTWKDRANVLSISSDDVTNLSASTIDVNGDAAGAASTPYTINSNPVDHYQYITFDPIATEAEITFSWSSGTDKRFVMYGINQEGGVLPELDHIVITGNASTTEYEAGDEFDPAGLGVNAIYTLADVEQNPVAVDAADIEWSFAPAVLTAETESVTVTATYKGKQANKNVNVTVTVPTTPEIIATPASINFGIVNQNATVEAQGISVTLKAVAAATVTLDGDGFSIDKATLTELNSTITVTPVTTATGTFAATVTISDDADAADDVVINLSMTVEAVEDLSGTWVKATSVAAGDRIIIGATYQGATKTMGGQNTNNRAAVESTFEDLVLTPAEGTKTFLVVDAGDGKFALQALNGNYLTTATSGTGNHLLEAADYENNNAKWTIEIDGEGVASVVAAAGSKKDLQYNNSNDIFSCYSAGGQKPINIYKKGTPDYGSYQRNVTAGNYGTICLPQAGTITGATLFDLAGKDENYIYIDEAENNTTIVAGRPYIFLPTANEITVTYTSGETALAGSYNNLVGTFSPLSTVDDGSASALWNNYIIVNNKYIYVDANNCTLGKNRAYISSEVSAPVPAPANRRRVAIGGANAPAITTDIDNVQGDNAQIRKVLINGELFILRGEKMYDAKGQLVK